MELPLNEATGISGFEPELPESKSGVLPLHNIPRLSIKELFVQDWYLITQSGTLYATREL